MFFQTAGFQPLETASLSAWFADQLRNVAERAKVRRRQKHHEQAMAELADAPEWLREDLGVDERKLPPSSHGRRARIPRVVKSKRFW